MIRDIPFLLRKYGPELLVDVGWVHEYAGFDQNGTHHRLSFYDVMLVTAGSGWLEVDANRVAVEAGWVYFTAPGQVRRWVDVVGLDGLCLFFTAGLPAAYLRDPQLCERLSCFNPGAAPAALKLAADDAEALRRHLLKLARELPGAGVGDAELLCAWVFPTLLDLDRRFRAAFTSRASSVPTTTTAGTPLLARFRQLVGLHAASEHGVAFYARRLGVSAGHLSALTRLHDGRGAKAWIAEKLLLAARRQLLDDSTPVAVVAEQLGFVDPAYFSRFFRRHTGVAPDRWRAEQRRTTAAPTHKSLPT